MSDETNTASGSAKPQGDLWGERARDTAIESGRSSGERQIALHTRARRPACEAARVSMA